MNLTEYYGQPGDGEMAVVLGTEIMEERALMSGDQIYLPLDMVNTYLNQRYSGIVLTSKYFMRHLLNCSIILQQRAEKAMYG